jgi:hypothetical protein
MPSASYVQWFVQLLQQKAYLIAGGWDSSAALSSHTLIKHTKGLYKPCFKLKPSPFRGIVSRELIVPLAIIDRISANALELIILLQDFTVSCSVSCDADYEQFT